MNSPIITNLWLTKLMDMATCSLTQGDDEFQSLAYFNVLQ
jgi:hypothetical protein